MSPDNTQHLPWSQQTTHYNTWIITRFYLYSISVVYERLLFFCSRFVMTSLVQASYTFLPAMFMFAAQRICDMIRCDGAALDIWALGSSDPGPVWECNTSLNMINTFVTTADSLWLRSAHLLSNTKYCDSRVCWQMCASCWWPKLCQWTRL